MLEPDKSDSFVIHRLDRILCGYGFSGSFADIKSINTEFASEKRILVEDVYKIGSVTEDDIDQKLYEVLSDTSMLVLMTDCLEEFSDLSSVEHLLGTYFHRMKKYLPNSIIPYVYTQFSGLRESIVVKDTLVGISLDKYLGKSYPPYEKYFNEEERNTMISSRIATDCLFYYLLSISDAGFNSTLDHLFSIGKAAYLTCLISHKSLDRVFGMSEENRFWLDKNRTALLGLLGSSPDAFYLCDQMREATSKGYQVLPVLFYPLIKRLMDKGTFTCEDLLEMDGNTIMNIINESTLISG